MRSHLSRRDPQRLVKGRAGFIKPPQRLQGDPDRVERPHLGRVEVEYSSVRCNRLLVAIERKVGAAEIEMGVEMIRIDRQAFLELGDRLFASTEPRQRVAELVVGLDTTRLQRNDLLVMGDRFRDAIDIPQKVGKAEMGLRIVGLDLGRSLEMRYGRLGASEGVKRRAERMARA